MARKCALCGEEIKGVSHYVHVGHICSGCFEWWPDFDVPEFPDDIVGEIEDSTDEN